MLVIATHGAATHLLPYISTIFDIDLFRQFFIANCERWWNWRRKEIPVAPGLVYRRHYGRNSR
jgi:hypothetical protein